MLSLPIPIFRDDNIAMGASNQALQRILGVLCFCIHRFSSRIAELGSLGAKYPSDDCEMSLLTKILKRTLLAIAGFFLGFVSSIVCMASYSTFEEALSFAPIAGIILGILSFIFGQAIIDWIIGGL